MLVQISFERDGKLKLGKQILAMTIEIEIQYRG